MIDYKLNPFRAALRGLISIAAMNLAVSLSSVQAGSPVHRTGGPFPSMKCLGDSLSDTGRFHETTGGALPPPYYEGRFSNGPIWNEYLAEMLGIDLRPASQFAIGGAMTDDGNFNVSFLPGFEQQVQEVLAENGRRRVDPRALYTVWIGANDFFAWLGSGDSNPGAMVQDGVENSIKGIADLSDAGARYVLVFNLPDLGRTPAALGLGEIASGLLTNLSAAYNALLAQELDELDRRRGLRIVRVDAFDLINDMVSNPGAFGFTNVTEQGILNTSGGEASGYLFWDGVHPTTVAHEYVAQEALGALESEFPAVRRLRWCRAADFRDRVEHAAMWSKWITRAGRRGSRR